MTDCRDGRKVLSRVGLVVVRAAEKIARTTAIRQPEGAVNTLTEVGLKTTQEAVHTTRGAPVRGAVGSDE